MVKLNFDDCLRKDRFRRSDPDAIDLRTEFERDYDRVIFSSSFRRLQDKTQVWPLEAHDFVRTRLTHSCEASAIGRSLANTAFRKLKTMTTNYDPAEPAAAVATACLLHDIGNPPFGHTGEIHIGQWFEDLLKEQPLQLDEQERTDLTKFEGNAHALRVATKLQTLGKPNGMNLTYGTLSTLLKYPWASTDDAAKKYKRPKYGHFKSEAKQFEEIREKTGLSGTTRHPLVYLVEAADDIAYSAVDIEDGFKKGCFAFDDFVNDANSTGGFVEQFVARHLKSEFDSMSSDVPVSERRQMAFQRFRVWAIGKTSGAVIRKFVDSWDAIIAGSLNADLVSGCDHADLVTFLRKFAKKRVYAASEVVKTERAARHVIRGLLDILWDESHPDSKLLPILIPSVVPDKDDGACSPDYLKCQRIADYVAGMTDAYAFALHSRLTGTRQ